MLDFGALYGYKLSDKSIRDTAVAYEYNLSAYGYSVSKFRSIFNKYINRLVKSGIKLNTSQLDEDVYEYVNSSTNTVLVADYFPRQRRILIGFNR